MRAEGLTFLGQRDGRFIDATGSRGLLAVFRGVAALPGQVVVCSGSVSWKPDLQLEFLTFFMPWTRVVDG